MTTPPILSVGEDGSRFYTTVTPGSSTTVPIVLITPVLSSGISEEIKFTKIILTIVTVALSIIAIIASTPTDAAGAMFLCASSSICMWIILPMYLGRALLRAGDECDVEKIEHLLDKGANPNYKNRNGHTPLINVSRFGIHDQNCYKEEVKDQIYSATEALLRNGANPEVRDPSTSVGDTPLYFAIMRLDPKTAQLLINCGAKPNAETIEVLNGRIREKGMYSSDSPNYQATEELERIFKDYDQRNAEASAP